MRNAPRVTLVCAGERPKRDNSSITYQQLRKSVAELNGQVVPASRAGDKLSQGFTVFEGRHPVIVRCQRSDSVRENEGNQVVPFWADMALQIVENLSTSMSWIRSIGARIFIAGMALAGSVVFALAFAHWQTDDLVKFVCYLIAALLASSLKVSLPGIEGTLSVNFLFTLLGILELSLPETLTLGLASTLAQFYWKPARRVKPVQLVFNLSQVTLSSAIAYGAYKFVVLHVLHAPGPLALLVAAITHFGCNTLAMSTIIGLTEEKSIRKVWGGSHLWLFPYYMVGAAVAGLVHFLNGHIGWQSSLLVLPPIYLMYRSYRLYLGKLETEKLHAEKVSNLHLRTIEALALAIEAKDETPANICSACASTRWNWQKNWV